MKNIILILTCIIVGFLFNIFLYAASDTYRDFIKWVKYQETEAPSEEKNVKQEKIIQIQKEEEEKKQEEAFLEARQKLEAQTGTDFLEIQPKTTKPEIKLDAYDEYFFSLFDAYNLVEENRNRNLLWITDEFPDPYFEKKNNFLHLYSFPTKNFEEIKEIFETLALSLPIELNYVNNFGTRSFYLNLTKGFDDDTVRIIFEKDNRTFWLKIKKDNYNEVKNTLLKINN